MCIYYFSKEHSSALKHTCINDKRLSAEEVAALEKAGSGLHRCAFSKCSSREVVAVICHFCKSNFCFPHRHPPDHLCLKLPKPRTEDHMPKTTAVVRDIIRARQAAVIAAESSTAPTPARHKKINPTALKVKLMKLKMKARGEKGLPEHDRIYLEIKLPDGQQKPYFFSKMWTVGRCTDFICENEGILNNNNRPDAKRLFLQTMEQSTEGGFSHFLDSSEAMDSLLKKGVVRDADELVLTYHGSQ